MAITRDLGIVTAYGYAKSKGYTGTEEEFAILMADYADVADIAEAWAVGTRAGVPVEEGDEAYHNNSKYYAEQSADSASAASDSAGLASGSAGAAKDSENAAAASEAAAKDYADHIADPVSGLVTGWLNDHVDPSTGYVIDDTLTVQGAAADAKATGDAVADLKSALEYDRAFIGNRFNKTITIDLEALPVYRSGGYYSNDGTWNANPNYWVCAVPIYSDFDSFYFELGTNTILDLAGCVFLPEGNAAPFALRNTGNAPTNPYLVGNDYVGGLIVINKGSGSGYKNIVITRYPDNSFPYDCVVTANGYWSDSAGTVVNLRLYEVVKLSIDHTRTYFVNPDYNNTPVGYAYDSTDTFLGNVAINDARIDYPEATSYIMLTLKYTDYVYSKSEYTFCDVIKKPFTFSGVNSIWFGDSITQNVYTDVNGTPYYDQSKVYRALFCAAFNMYSGNFAQGGTSFAFGYTSSAENPQGSIVYCIENKSIGANIPYIFISGGTNDCGYGVPLGDVDSTDNTTFNGALNELSTHLNTNYSDKTIFILSPINRVQKTGNEILPLDEYRQALFLWSMKNKYNFVDMSDSGFPNEALSYYRTFFGDGLHPTIIGHEMMANVLRRKLC